MPRWHLYMLQCRDRSLYTGVTLDIERRMKQHSDRQGSKCLRGRLPVKLVHQESFRSRSLALKREAEIKGWPRQKKLRLVNTLCYNSKAGQEKPMKKTVCSLFILVPTFLGLLVPAFLYAETNTGDPNAEIRKITGKDSALADFERLKRTQNDLAIVRYSSLIKKNPKDALSYARRGRAFSDNRDYDKALEDYNKALALNPNTTEAYIGRAVVYLMKKDYDKCWADVHKAESMGGKFWPAFMDSLKAGSKRDK